MVESVLRNRLKAMTSAQMDFLGLREFKFDETSQAVDMALYVNNVGDIPIQIQLKNRKLDTAKVTLACRRLIIGLIQRTIEN